MQGWNDRQHLGGPPRGCALSINCPTNSSDASFRSLSPQSSRCLSLSSSLHCVLSPFLPPSPSCPVQCHSFPFLPDCCSGQPVAPCLPTYHFPLWVALSADQAAGAAPRSTAICLGAPGLSTGCVSHGPPWAAREMWVTGRKSSLPHKPAWSVHGQETSVSKPFAAPPVGRRWHNCSMGADIRRHGFSGCALSGGEKGLTRCYSM